MKPKNAKIDSFNFSGGDLEILFNGNTDNYSIQEVKGISTFEPQIWLKTFGKSLTRHITEAKIIHTNMGLAIPLKRFSVSPQKQTLEFAGLHSYSDKSQPLKVLLNELYEHIQAEIITRVDVAIDYKGKIPSRVIKALEKSRTPFHYINTSYFKTDSEDKTNSYINICIYPKHIKEHLDEEIERLEFSFRGSYLRGNYLVKDLDKALLKMQKTIKRFIGTKVAIQPL